jgi:hypothetical protein
VAVYRQTSLPPGVSGSGDVCPGRSLFILNYLVFFYGEYEDTASTLLRDIQDRVHTGSCQSMSFGTDETPGDFWSNHSTLKFRQSPLTHSWFRGKWAETVLTMLRGSRIVTESHKNTQSYKTMEE